MVSEVIHYKHDNIDFKGFLTKPETIHGKLPAILVAHAWRGQDDFARQKAEALSKQGYVAFAVDIFGNGTTAKSDEEAMQLMLPFFLDRKLLRERINSALEELKKQACVNSDAIGAIGFCFGGLSVIELMRSGADLKGVVSFHGLLGTTLGKYKASLALNSHKIRGSLLMLHGYKDPQSSPSDIAAIQDEFTKAGIDWQMNIYGQALHAFTNPQANNEKGGMVYNQQAAERSWLAMTQFFKEIFRL